MAVAVQPGAGAGTDAGIDAEMEKTFLQTTQVNIVVPLATDRRLEKALVECRGGSSSSPRALLAALKQRETLFFDETVDVYFVLQTAYQDEMRLRALLDRLSLSLEAHITNSSIPGRETPPAVEAIFQGGVDMAETVLVASDAEADDGDDGSDDEEQDEDEENGQDDETEKRGNDGTNGLRGPNGTGRQTLVVWRLGVFLARPRARLHIPSVSFSVSASLGQTGAGGPGTAASTTTGFLRSRQPSGLNLLAALAGDPALLSADGVDAQWPMLSAQRVSRVAPVGLGHGLGSPNVGGHTAMRVPPPTVLPIVPAVHARIRFVRPSTVPTSAAVVGVLELDFTPFFECEAVLTRVDVTVDGGTVTDLNGAEGDGDGDAVSGMALPLFCVARDHVTFLYRLAPPAHGFDVARNTIPTVAPAASRALSIAVEARVLAQPGVCEPRLAMAWTTAVDFSLPVNPGFGTALPAVPLSSMQRGAGAHRPSQLSIDGMSSLFAPAVSRPDALPALEAAARSTETTIPDFGITMTLTAPDRPVYAGEEFCWTVFVVNRAEASGSAGAGTAGTGAGGSGTSSVASGPTAPRLRKLALLALPRRRRNDVRVMRPLSMAGRPRAATNRSEGFAMGLGLGLGLGAGPGLGLPAPVPEVADAFLDENVVHAMQRSSLVDGTDMVCLSADTRVGPLAPHACHVVELRFVALQAGAVGVEAIRVVDLGSQEHVDVRELPAMVVLERPAAAVAAVAAA